MRDIKLSRKPRHLFLTSICLEVLIHYLTTWCYKVLAQYLTTWYHTVLILRLTAWCYKILSLYLTTWWYWLSTWQHGIIKYRYWQSTRQNDVKNYWLSTWQNDDTACQNKVIRYSLNTWQHEDIRYCLTSGEHDDKVLTQYLTTCQKVLIQYLIKWCQKVLTHYLSKWFYKVLAQYLTTWCRTCKVPTDSQVTDKLPDSHDSSVNNNPRDIIISLTSRMTTWRHELLPDSVHD